MEARRPWGGGEEGERGVKPFSEPADAVFQVTSCFEFRVSDCYNGNIRESMAKQGAQVLGEAAEGIVAALEKVVSFLGCGEPVGEVD